MKIHNVIFFVTLFASLEASVKQCYCTYNKLNCKSGIISCGPGDFSCMAAKTEINGVTVKVQGCIDSYDSKGQKSCEDINKFGDGVVEHVKGCVESGDLEVKKNCKYIDSLPDGSCYICTTDLCNSE
ncbi:uncharacterized protein LOC123004362 [Tribolium madens]|uniref:uncharacterized protein LOC123004362 n=1 Tax=Tribolium madens TaxID=41895 RepID=UPI001CF75FA3|nr:uncharacterized protein LOC123004362 [Tribolium madens]